VGGEVRTVRGLFEHVEECVAGSFGIAAVVVGVTLSDGASKASNSAALSGSNRALNSIPPVAATVAPQLPLRRWGASSTGGGPSGSTMSRTHRSPYRANAAGSDSAALPTMSSSAHAN